VANPVDSVLGQMKDNGLDHRHALLDLMCANLERLYQICLSITRDPARAERAILGAFDTLLDLPSATANDVLREVVLAACKVRDRARATRPPESIAVEFRVVFTAINLFTAIKQGGSHVTTGSNVARALHDRASFP
jgi:hypothetical protein